MIDSILTPPALHMLEKVWISDVLLVLPVFGQKKIPEKIFKW
jgi:hypothetical protein